MRALGVPNRTRTECEAGPLRSIESSPSQHFRVPADGQCARLRVCSRRMTQQAPAVGHDRQGECAPVARGHFASDDQQQPGVSAVVLPLTG